MDETKLERITDVVNILNDVNDAITGIEEYFEKDYPIRSINTRDEENRHIDVEIRKLTAVFPEKCKKNRAPADDVAIGILKNAKASIKKDMTYYYNLVKAVYETELKELVK